MKRLQPRKFIPKVGGQVWCCYDGKFGRRVQGTTVKRLGPKKFLVSFDPWASDGEQAPITMLANMQNCYHAEGWVTGDGELGVMRAMRLDLVFPTNILLSGSYAKLRLRSSNRPNQRVDLDDELFD